MSKLTPDRANRLAIGIARNRRIHYDEAERVLHTLSVRIVLSSDSAATLSAQFAFLTAVNTAQRCFLGGVKVECSSDIPCALPIPGMNQLEDAFNWIGFRPRPLQSPPVATIFVGEPGKSATPDDVRVFCDAWRGGVANVANDVPFQVGDGDHVGLGGILAGALAVHRVFASAVGLPSRSVGRPTGLSLWNPGDNWTRPIEAKLRNLPTRFWMLGMGHLGQAFLWSLASLPFPAPRLVEFLLHDFDVIDESNYGSGLLCDSASVGRKKVRHCADWLEALGFSTKCTERRFTAVDRCADDEPKIAFCGFDRIEPRLHLDNAGFGLVIECGLGGSLSDFDQLDLHTFPSAKHSAAGLWGAMSLLSFPPSEDIVRLFGPGNEVCGALAIDIAGKSVSTSFVGAIASTIAVSELLRTFNGGPRFDAISFDARDERQWDFRGCDMRISASQLAVMGFTTL